MDDRDYVKLKPELMGFRYVGQVPQEARPLLTRAYEDLKRSMGATWDQQIAAREICWMNIWQEDDEGDAMELSDKALAAELQGEVRMAFLPQGLVCEIDAPIPEKPVR